MSPDRDTQQTLSEHEWRRLFQGEFPHAGPHIIVFGEVWGRADVEIHSAIEEAKRVARQIAEKYGMEKLPKLISDPDAMRGYRYPIVHIVGHITRGMAGVLRSVDALLPNGERFR